MQEEEARRMAALAGYAEGRTGGIGRKGGGRGGRRLTAEEVDKMLSTRSQAGRKLSG